MIIDTDKLISEALRAGLLEGVKQKLSSSYDNPVSKLISDAIVARSADFRTILDDALKSCLSDDSFRVDIATAVRVTLAKQLVQKFGGELEKQVNSLKSDPATRARITLAIEEIVKTKCESSLQTA